MTKNRRKRTEPRRIVAHEIHPPLGMAIVAAPLERDWMNSTDQRYAYRCLPLVIANQAGWMILNAADFSVRWNGGPERKDLRIRFDRKLLDPRVVSNFGYGVVTFSLPYLFRTPRGVNLWVKGPANCVKDGVQALEGIVETDWSASTFTMNWKLTRPGHSVRFERGEPICMIVPVERGLAEQLEPVRKPIAEDAELHAEYQQWERGRSDFIRGLDQAVPEVTRRGWQRDYFLGLRQDGRRVASHQTRLPIREFAATR